MGVSGDDGDGNESALPQGRASHSGGPEVHRDPAATTGKLVAIRSYLRFMWTFKGSMAVVVSMFVVASLLLAVVPLFVGQFVATLAATRVDTGEVYRYVIILIVCSSGHDLAWRAAELCYLKLLNHRTYEYENLLFKRVVNERYPYFVDKFTGKISSYVGTLGREFRSFLDRVCFTYVELLVKLPAVAAIMFAVNVWTGVVFVGSVVVMFAIGRVTIRRVAVEEKKYADVGSTMDGHVIDVVANFVSVKSFGREEAEYREVSDRRREVVAAANRSFFWNVVFWSSMSLVVRHAVWPATIVLNVHLFLAGDLSLADFTTFLSALLLFSDFVWVTIWETAQLNLLLARIEEAYRYLFGEAEVVPGRRPANSRTTATATAVATTTAIATTTATAIATTVAATTAPSTATAPNGPAAFSGSLRLNNLAFGYPDDASRQALAGVDLEISCHEKVGVVGRSGSGKTTLVKLLLGYYTLPTGMITLDGRPVRDRDLARFISYVPQDTALFHRTIRANIAYGAEAAVTDDQVETAARRAHAHEFAVDTPLGYDTLVGERGIKLSTGQRQRIAIARAFLDDKPILVLDEATSALDSESEVLVQRSLEDLWHDKTVVAVAHRLSTLLQMDRIVVLDGGRIVEQGSHHDLVAAGGHYSRLWKHQSGGMIASA